MCNFHENMRSVAGYLFQELMTMFQGFKRHAILLVAAAAMIATAWWLQYSNQVLIHSYFICYTNAITSQKYSNLNAINCGFFYAANN